MAINLQKGQKIDIGLTKLSVGLGWNPNEGTGNAFDLDASAFMIDANRSIPEDAYFVFYGNTDSPDKSLHHTGDDPTGGNSADGDDETNAKTALRKRKLLNAKGSYLCLPAHGSVNRRRV